jgi:membrane-bound lytic murein transglycosylase A
VARPARPPALLLALLLLVACGKRPEPVPETPRLVLTPTSFALLPDWPEDDPQAALAAFRRSCAVLLRRPAERPMAPSGVGGTAGDWHATCHAAAAVADGPAAARAFFETAFTPWQVADRDEPEGLFTGYYEPLLRGARGPDARFRWPLYRRPDDLVRVELAAFDPELAGKRIAGRVEAGQLVPYPDRAAIDDGALAARGLELLWVDDPVDRFFLEIQGSGQVELADGSRTRVGYAEQNGRPYRAIGRDLVAMGELAREQVSLQSIRAWLAANPDRAFELMHKNPSVVFFRELPELGAQDGPLGALEVPLTPGRSLAVDRSLLPLGAPVFLDTVAPFAEGERPFRALLIAQDTGGAIRGPVRGDVFWGNGAAAEHVAGHMRSRGRYYLLLPRHLDPVS